MQRCSTCGRPLVKNGRGGLICPIVDAGFNCDAPPVGKFNEDEAREYKYARRNECDFPDDDD
jgi:uncharacterized Zn finger protein (UPF0148 family)